MDDRERAHHLLEEGHRDVCPFCEQRIIELISAVRAEAAAAERERCAKIADIANDPNENLWSPGDIAAAIRALGEQEGK